MLVRDSHHRLPKPAAIVEALEPRIALSGDGVDDNEPLPAPVPGTPLPPPPMLPPTPILPG